MINQTISHYKVLEKLGEGGMGVVYKAEDTTLDRLVALKFLPPHLSASEQDRARFRQEAKAAAALNHPNVCSIIEIAEHEGKTFIVMEFVDGQTLREKIGSLGAREAIEIGIQVAEGLAAAHEKGIIHRDIKPENIMIRRSGSALIMDFGLAKLRPGDSKISRLTKAGSTLGTAGYMSAEQVQGQPTDHRSDIFSYGVLLYEMLTGQLPFRGAHEMALAYEIVNVDPPPMAAIKSEIDPALDAIVLECLEKDINERTQSIKQVAVDLKRVRRESTKQRVTRVVQTRFDPVPAGESHLPPHESRPSAPSLLAGRTSVPWNRIVFPALCVLLAATLAWILLDPLGSNRPAEQLPSHFMINFPGNAAHVGGSEGIAISPDGKYLVYTGSLPRATQLFLRRIDQPGVTPIPGTEEGTVPAFSPDGGWVAYYQADKIKKVSISGGAPQDISGTEGTPRGIWWADNNMIYFGHIAKAIQRVAAEGGTPEPASSLDGALQEISHRYPQLLPDGKTILYTVKQSTITSFDDALIAVENVVTHERKILIRGGTFARYTPNGFLVFVRGKSIYGVPFDLERLELEGTPELLMDGGWQNYASGTAELTFSNTGTLIFSSKEPVIFNTVGISWLDRQGKLTQILDTRNSYFAVSLSPDGEKLALTISAANDDIWIYQIKRGILSRCTFGGGNSGNPIWSPDGKYIVYFSEKGKAPNLFKKPWDGSGAEERLTSSTNAQLPTDVSSDGSTLAFTQNGDIWILPMQQNSTPTAYIQSPATEDDAVFSPDGRWMAYTSNESGRLEVYVVPFPRHEGKWQVSSNGGTRPAWSTKGSELFFISGTELMGTEITPGGSFDFAVPKKICDLPANSVGFFDLATDGARFLLGISASDQILTSSHLDVIVNWFDFIERRFSGR